MTLGLTPRRGGSLASTAAFCEGRVAPDSAYALLHRECSALFPDEMFADLFAVTGRPSVPPVIVAVVMVLQRLAAGWQRSRNAGACHRGEGMLPRDCPGRGGCGCPG